jgi:hypothetical protein
MVANLLIITFLNTLLVDQIIPFNLLVLVPIKRMIMLISNKKTGLMFVNGLAMIDSKIRKL